MSGVQKLPVGISYRVEVIMKSFKDYANDQPKEKEREQETEAASAEELTKKIASAYHGKSNGDMLKSILAEAEKSKRAGTLTNAEIENFYQTFSPMLDSGQRKKLRAIVEKLKQI